MPKSFECVEVLCQRVRDYGFESDQKALLLCYIPSSKIRRLHKSHVNQRNSNNKSNKSQDNQTPYPDRLCFAKQQISPANNQGI